MSINYYEVLGVPQDASEKDILRGYRRKALTCHPDKNPDNPKAAELFIQLSEALEILTDPAARVALDKILKAKEAAKQRTQAYDSKRKKFKEDLEQREKAAELEKESDAEAAEQLAARIKRLREEGSRLLKEQQELMRKLLAEEKQRNEEQMTPKLKVKWTANKKDHQNGGYNEAILKELFGKYGEVTMVLLSQKRNGLAVIEFGNAIQANIALEFEKGIEENPLTVRWLDGSKQEKHSTNIHNDKQDNNKCDTNCADSANVKVAPQLPSFDDDFENLVLKRMREAEERKRMTNQIIETDKKGEGEGKNLT